MYRWPDGEPVAVTKMHALPHIRAVLTGRGMSTVRQFAAEQITHARDFDHAVELLNRALPELPTLSGTYKGEPMMHTVQLVGWSDAHGCMALASWESGNGYCGSVRHVESPGACFRYLGPATKRPEWLFDQAQVAARQTELSAWLLAESERDPKCSATAAAYARAAVAQAREEDPQSPYGGRLLVAELTRDEVRIVDAGDLGLPPRRAGAPDLITDLAPGLAATCIAANAATDTFADETGANSTSFTSSGGASFVTCATRSYANALSRPVVLQWDAEVSDLHFSAGATLNSPDDYVVAQWVLEINGTPVLTDTFIDSTADLVPPSATAKKSRSVGWQYTLAAGATARIYIAVGGGTDLNPSTVSWSRTRLRTSVIKA